MRTAPEDSNGITALGDIVTDIWNADKRSAVMARIRGKDTKPELIVRSLLHRAGVRFSLRRKDLPGKRKMHTRGATVESVI